MFLTLIKREMLDNLMGFRFFVAMIATLVLVVANTVVLIKDYERRLISYNSAVKQHHEKVSRVKVYSELDGSLLVDRSPNPLSTFNAGLDRRLGNAIAVRLALVPTLWDTELHSADNPFLNLFSSVDIVLIFQVIISLLALLFAYNAIAGEREAGTLRLTLTNRVSRPVILLAKYLSAMACLILPVIISFLLVLILFTMSESVLLRVDDYIRICGILLTTIIYLSAFYLMGLLISVITRRTATAIMLSMVIWSSLVLIYPSLSVFTVNRLWQESSRLKAAYREIQQIWEEFEKERIDYLKNDGVEGENPGFNVRGSGSSGTLNLLYSATLDYFKPEYRHWTQIEEGSEPLIPYVKAYFQVSELQRIRAAERAWLVRQSALNHVYVQKANIARNLMRLSPAAMYDLATEAWAGTDYSDMSHFITAVRQYRQTLINYFHDKEAFRSRQWFASDKGVVDWSDLPQFTYHPADVLTGFKRASGDMFCLLLINFLLFMITFLIFIRQEV